MGSTIIPGPMGSTPAPGNPPTAANPQPQPQPTGGQAWGSYLPSAPGNPGATPDSTTNAYSPQQQTLEAIFNSQKSGIGAATAQQINSLTNQGTLANAQLSTTDAQLLQQYQNAQAQQGISSQELGQQGTQIGQQSAYQGQQYQNQLAQNALSGTGLTEALANLNTNYGYTQQGLALQGTEAQQSYGIGQKQLQQSGAASGTGGTGTQAQGQQQLSQQLQDTLKSLGIETGQAATAYGYGKQQNALSQQQLALQGKGEAQTNTYQQQQIQDALNSLNTQYQQLGLTGTENTQSYQQGTQNASDSNANLQNQLIQQKGAAKTTETSDIGQLYAQLYGAAPYSGSV